MRRVSMAVVTAFVFGAMALPAAASPSSQSGGTGQGPQFTISVYGDSPYGNDTVTPSDTWQLDHTPQFIDHINADPRFGAAETASQAAARKLEQQQRTDADLRWLDHAFDAASRAGDKGVVVIQQADTVGHRRRGDPPDRPQPLHREHRRSHGGVREARVDARR
jgi:hypothetical protein